MLNKILNFLFPPVCGICLKNTDDWICKSCLDKLNIKLNKCKNEINGVKYNLYFKDEEIEVEDIENENNI